MPSPFPGMDPYLEHPQVFPDLHGGMVFCLKEALQPMLPGLYFATAGDRVWVEVTDLYIEPDVKVSRRSDDHDSGETGGGVALAAPPRTHPVLVSVPHDERREAFLEIYTRRDGDEQLVTVIEVLSLSNKTRGERGRELYVRKQAELLEAKVNLVEIDLLRAGEHTTAALKRRIVRETGPFDYHVCLRRFFDMFGDFYVYPIGLEHPLPQIDIPLLPDDEPVTVDLQAVFTRTYDAGAYQKRIRYQEETPAPPLTDEQQAWARRLLESKMG